MGFRGEGAGGGTPGWSITRRRSRDKVGRNGRSQLSAHYVVCNDQAAVPGGLRGTVPFGDAGGARIEVRGTGSAVMVVRCGGAAW